MTNEFKYDNQECFFVKEYTYNGVLYKKGSMIELSEKEYNILKEAKVVEAKNLAWYSKEIRIGLLFQIIISLLVLITFSILLIIGIEILLVAIFVQTLFFIVGLYNILSYKKIINSDKKTMMFFGIFTIIPIFLFYKGEIVKAK